MSSKIIIGVSSRLCKNKFENRDSLSTDWYKFFKKLNILEKANWIILPNIGKDIKKYIHKNKINRFILTGGEDIGVYKKRDITENEIIKYALNNKIPLVGVCRGMQLLHKFFNGKLKKIKNNTHVGKYHYVYIGNKRIKVNSFHNNGIEKNKLVNNFKALAISKENYVESFKLINFPIYGIMWHPERNNIISSYDKQLFNKILNE